MQQYHDLVADVLQRGGFKRNRTDVATISSFSHHYRVDLQQGFPLLTTKDMDGYRWRSLIHELLWYFSGEEHIRNLREETSIWDAWADEDGRLETAYGRFWRRYPVPDEGLDGEAWPDDGHRWTREDEHGRTFDQLQYVIDTLRERPHSRRLVVNAWHPANAAVSKLPPCHYTFTFNVQDGRLNTQLTQRSGDLALGVPFNIAAYALITHIVAQQADLEPGTFAHTIVDAHVYCGKGDRADFYRSRLDELQDRLRGVESRDDYRGFRDWLDDAAPPEPDGEEDHDHVPGLLEQLSREPLDRPSIRVADKDLDDLAFDDIELENYQAHDGIRFAVAE
ncbi:MAG: thymidylate synthase [Candidatus Nanohaloarchaea archaeon]|nr:thymidylate synthase [Candidatus Nanohaloarchaea archaeon]